MIFLTNSGVFVAEGICRNTHLHDCVDQNPLGNGDVGVVILEFLIHFNVHPTWVFAM